MTAQKILDNSVYISRRDKNIRTIAKMVRQKKDLSGIDNGLDTIVTRADESIDRVIEILSRNLEENKAWKMTGPRGPTEGK